MPTKIPTNSEISTKLPLSAKHSALTEFVISGVFAIVDLSNLSSSLETFFIFCKYMNHTQTLSMQAARHNNDDDIVYFHFCILNSFKENITSS